MAIKLGIICPCFNEEEVLEKSATVLKSVVKDLIDRQKIDKSSFVLFVNDGSSDLSWEIISKLHNSDNCFKGLNLSFNSGHQFALMAGMNYAKNKVDAAITIDVDLQDDVGVIPEMINKFNEGNDVVYGVKNGRKVDPFFKRLTAKMFYRWQRHLGLKIVIDHADFRLVSNRVLNILSNYKESNIYLRGIIPSWGLKSDIVSYDIKDRTAGDSKYTKKKMLKLATDGILGFSPAPLKGIIFIGIIFLIIALINAVDIVVSLINGTAQPGWSQLMLSMWFVGGVILIALGLVGIYIGRTYSEVKHRPQYLILDVLD